MNIIPPPKKRTLGPKNMTASKLTNAPLSWDSNARLISRLQSDWTVKRTRLEDVTAYDGNSIEVREFVEGKDHPEPFLTEVVEKEG